MMADVLVTCGHLQRHIAQYQPEIEAAGFSVWVPPLTGQQFNAAQMAEMLAQCRVVIAGDDPLGQSELEAGRKGYLHGVVRWGIGTDNVDKPTATRLGLPVYNTPGMFNNEVADLALAHLLCLVRHVHKMDRDVRAGLWTRYEGTSLYSKVLGIVGLGGIGREVARRARACGMQVIGSDVAEIDKAALDEVGAIKVRFAQVLAESDVIVMACNLTEEILGEDITIYGDGSQTRSFCYVDDMIEGLVRLMNSQPAPEVPVNIGNENEFTVLKLAERVLNYTSSNAKIVFLPLPSDDPTRRKPDTH